MRLLCALTAVASCSALLKAVSPRARSSPVNSVVNVESRLEELLSPPQTLPPLTLKKQHEEVELDERGLFVGGALLFERCDEHAYATLQSVGRVESQDEGGFVHFDMPASAAEFDIALGLLPVGDRTLALARSKRWWMTPAFDGEIPLETQTLVCEAGRKHVVVLPLLDGSFRCTLRGEAVNGRTLVVARCESGDPTVRSRVMRRAMWFGSADDASEVQSLLSRGVDQGTAGALTRKSIPRAKIVDGLGWCSWDAFYSAVDLDKLREGLGSIKEQGVSVQRLIVDDGWMELDKQISTDTLSGETLGGDSYVVPSKKVTRTASDVESTRRRRYRAVYIAAFVRFFDMLIQSVQDYFAVSVARFYAKFVERADYGSWGSILWRGLTSTVLRAPLMEFYEKQTDFTRMMASPPRPSTEKFGGISGLAAFIAEIKNSKDPVRHVACWHAVAGYWGGFDDPDTERLRQEPSRSLRQVEPAMSWDPASLDGTQTPTTPAQVDAMYERLYAMLDECGVDSVKADAQSGVGSLGHSKGGGPWAAKVFVDAMEKAASRHFNSGSSLGVVNCMCHSTEQLYSYARSAVVRASDDFYPREEASWRYHLAACAFNSVLLSAVALPDWDMFQSKHPAAWQHAAARCVSGGPVTISDAPGQHDEAVLRAVAFPDGGTLVALAPARLTADSLYSDVSRDGKSSLKVVAPNPAGGAVVGIFNVQGAWWCRKERRFVQSPASALLLPHLKLSDVSPAWRHELLDESNLEARRSALLVDTFVARSFKTGDLTLLRSSDELHGVALAPGDFDVVSLSRVRGTVVRWAALGLVDMLNGGAAVLEATAFENKGTILARGPGRFQIYAEKQPTTVTVDGQPHPSLWDAQTLTIDLPRDATIQLNWGEAPDEQES